MLALRAASNISAVTVPAACPKCGTKVTSTAEDAHRRIQDLESQVRTLNDKAAAAVDKLADYEDEVRTLKAQCARLQQQQQQQRPLPARQTTPTSSTPELAESPIKVNNSLQVSPPRAASRLASISSFFTSRQRDPITPTPTSSQPPTIPDVQNNQAIPAIASPLASSATASTPSTLVSRLDQLPTPSLSLQTLQSTLEDERSKRLQAETSLNQTQTELEELTAQLFGQANEMVAAERKARHKLEERVKVLENRDGEKRRRLERLEKALQRIERVRGLVERRNTVNGFVDTSQLDIQSSHGEEETQTEDDVQVDATAAADSEKKEIKRKAVGTGTEKFKDRERSKTERKGTI